MPNVNLHGTVPHAKIYQFYQQTAVLICTSLVEGFPNIFLEAWSYGLPVVSTFDPDNLITEKGLGKVGKDASELVAGIRELLDSPEKWAKASKTAMALVRTKPSSVVLQDVHLSLVPAGGFAAAAKLKSSTLSEYFSKDACLCVRLKKGKPRPPETTLVV